MVEMGSWVPSSSEFGARLDGNRCRSLAEFLREIGVALQFPSYYGENWDAFEECIHDLEWLPDAQIDLIVENADRLLPSEPEQEFRADMEWERALTIRLDGVSDGRILEAFAAFLER